MFKQTLINIMSEKKAQNYQKKQNNNSNHKTANFKRFQQIQNKNHLVSIHEYIYNIQIGLAVISVFHYFTIFAVLRYYSVRFTHNAIVIVVAVAATFRLFFYLFLSYTLFELPKTLTFYFVAYLG